jgi:hypothetical protein
MNADQTTSGDLLEGFALPQQFPIFLASWRLGVHLSLQRNETLNDNDTDEMKNARRLFSAFRPCASVTLMGEEYGATFVILRA